MVIRTNDRRNRVWERPKAEDILIEAKREIEKYFIIVLSFMFKVLKKEKSL